jgi:hypothetical protein
LFKHDAIEVYDCVDATMNADTELTAREEMSSKIRGQVGKGNGTDKSMEASTNTNWMEIQGIGVGFV